MVHFPGLGTGGEEWGGGGGISYPLRPEAVSKALEQVINPFLDYLPGAYYEPGTVLGPELEW